MFFDHIMHQLKDYLLYRFFQAQARFPTHRDWTGQVLEDFEVISLKIEFNDIKKCESNVLRIL